MKIIALVDGSTYSASVCDHAAWAAKRIGLGVELVHVLGRRDHSSVPADLSGNLSLGARSSLLQELSRADEERAKLSHARGRLILETAAERVRADGVEAVEERLRHDDILRTIADFEPDARLTVVGKRGEASAFAHDHLGSNLERILRAATRPVLVASRAFKPIERYLIAFDGSAGVMRSIERIAQGSMLDGLACTLLHVGADAATIRAKMEAAAALIAPKAGPVAIEFASGEPDRAISERIEAGGADLLVMGASGHGPIRRLFLGSTSASMAQLCKVPVVIFR
ncbi:MAG: universal stress protein [Rhodobacteraceae bacterium]|uniref:universal stress protein n=1 Tax=Amaricoccus sp. B4 TaxID=3368557 RepID=UPI000DAF2E8E|nr:universal stress protein [Paracoccaceae bacterium]